MLFYVVFIGPCCHLQLLVFQTKNKNKKRKKERVSNSAGQVASAFSIYALISESSSDSRLHKQSWLWGEPWSTLWDTELDFTVLTLPQSNLLRSVKFCANPLCFFLQGKLSSRGVEWELPNTERWKTLVCHVAKFDFYLVIAMITSSFKYQNVTLTAEPIFIKLIEVKFCTWKDQERY